MKRLLMLALLTVALAACDALPTEPLVTDVQYAPEWDTCAFFPTTACVRN